MNDTKSKAEELYLDLAASKPKSALPWFEDRRNEAKTAFASQGLPHRRIEAFKYTDIRAFDRAGYPLSEKSESRPEVGATLDGASIIRIVNGEALEDDCKNAGAKGLRVITLRTALATEGALLEEVFAEGLLKENALADLNLSLADNGVVIIASEKTTRPIEICYINDNPSSSVFVRNILVAEPGATLKVIETAEDAKAQSLNAVTFLKQGAASRVEHSRFDKGDEESLTMMLLSAHLGAEAHLESNALSLGSKMARVETQVRFAGEEATTTLNGVLAGSGKDHIDHTTYVSHEVPNCRAEENYRAILTDRAQGVFQGQISVAKYAQKTDSRMMARALLLSDNASMRAKPELEIYADDVKCAHGSTIGSLDDEALFYMMSRGIPEEEARALLVAAFSKDVLDAISDDALRAVFDEKLKNNLKKMI